MTTHDTLVTEPAGPFEDDDDLLDVTPPRRPSRVTAALLAGIVAAAGFAGGAYVQKRHDAGLTSAAAGPAGGAAAFRGGFGGTAPRGVEAPGGFGDAAPGAGSGAGSGGAAGGSGTAAPAVVGKVVAVSGTTLTVRNFAGRTVKVTVPDGASVTTAVPLPSLKAGTSVSVTGTAAVDGTVTATGVTAR